MRVLFVAAPAVGHLFPLVPLARTLRAHGHEVLFASFDGAEPVTGSGLPLANIAPGVKVYEELFKAGKEHRPDLLERSTATLGADREAFVALFAHVNDRVADGLVDLAGRWRPDLVVYEYISPIGLLAAAAVGVPAVQHDLGFVRTPGLRDVMLTELAGAFARHGIPSAPEPAEVIDITPPSMIDGGRYGVPMRPVPYNGEGTLPPLSDRTPKIAVTIGTVSAAMMGGLDRVRRIVEAAPEVDAQFLLALGDTDIADLGPLPPNVASLGWVPWHGLLAQCQAAVHHGGCGTTLTTLHAGLPQLVLPDGSDRFINADAVRDRGAGISAAADEVDADLLTRLLTDDKLRAVAGEVRAEIAAMPAPETLVDRLTEIALRD